MIERLVKLMKLYRIVSTFIMCTVCYFVPVVLLLLFNLEWFECILFFWGGMAYKSFIIWQSGPDTST